MRLALLLLALVSWNASAQYQGPAVEACRTYALQELRKEGSRVKDAVIERDAQLLIERYTRKVGSQFVSSVLSGNGAAVYEGAPSIELSFLCLLADEKRPVFFSWLPRRDASALQQCSRGGSTGRPCLDTLLQAAEAELGPLYANRLLDANERGEAALATYRRSNDEWRQYRDAECQRRRDIGPPAGAEERQIACIVDLTRRRAWDMK